MNQVFEGASLGPLLIRNRIIRSATHEGMGDAEGRPLPELEDLYLRLARGGAGAIITGYVGIQKNGRSMKNMRMFDNDTFIGDYRKMNARIGDHGVPVILQIAHGGGQTSRHVTGQRAVAPSARHYPLFSSFARELTGVEIEEIIDNFAATIERAREAGFAGVQLHAAAGYLLSEFLSPATNMRTDRWGGSTENRFRIMAEIIARAREKVGAYPILVKFSAYDADKNGIDPVEGVKIAELVQKAGYDALEVSNGGSDDGYNAMRVPRVPIDAGLKLVPWLKSISPARKMMMRLLGPLKIRKHKPLFNYNVEAAARIKRLLDIPVIVVGGIRRLADIESIIAEGMADCVSMCRPFIIEPDIVNRFREGAQAESRCINCGFCLAGVSARPLRCYHGRVRE